MELHFSLNPSSHCYAFREAYVWCDLLVPVATFGHSHAQLHQAFLYGSSREIARAYVEKLLGIMLRNRCKSTTFHIITAGDVDK